MLKKLLPGFGLLCICLFVQATSAFANRDCSGLDISFSSVTLTGVGNSLISYNVTIKNNGTQTIDVNKITLQNYVSTDDTYDVGDADGGASTLAGTTLLAGQELATSFYSNYSGDIKSLPYLILQLSYEDAECDVTNNEIPAARAEPGSSTIAARFDVVEKAGSEEAAYLEDQPGAEDDRERAGAPAARCGVLREGFVHWLRFWVGISVAC